jgi:hypothetical protein
MQAPVETIAPAADPIAMAPMKMDSANFKLSGNEFIPKGKMVATKEQFPDLDALGDDAPKKTKGKKGKKGRAVV